jgi:hypothetical protein
MAPHGNEPTSYARSLALQARDLGRWRFCAPGRDSRRPRAGDGNGGDRSRGGGTPDRDGGTAWAAGTTGFGTADALIVRWSGKAWTRVTSPSPGRDVSLSGLGFATAGNGWAVGAAVAGSDTSTTVILHWNGKTWS